MVTDTRAEVSSTVNGLTFKYTAGSFFQVRRRGEVDERGREDPRHVGTHTRHDARLTHLPAHHHHQQQNNPFVLPHMVRHVVDQARAGAGLRFLVDAYCGGGLFCLSASQYFEVRRRARVWVVWRMKPSRSVAPTCSYVDKQPTTMSTTHRRATARRSASWPC